MKISAITPDEYIAALPPERQAPMTQLRNVLITHLPPGFEETISYGSIGYVVPKTLYPAGYHCDTKLPLPFINIASQKNFIALYHMGIYAAKPLLDWFLEEWPKHSTLKLDMGKSCIRFKKPETIPLKLIAELAEKMAPMDWVEQYENVLKRT